MSLRRAAVAAAGSLVLALGLLIGLHTGSALAGHTGGTTPTTRTTATTVTTVPEPVVTTVAATTTTTASLPGKGKPVIVVGDTNTPEQTILGELYYEALEHEGYKVYLLHNATLPEAVAAIPEGSLNLFPAYLGAWNSSVAHLHKRFSTLAASYAAARHFAQRNGYVLLPPTPFSDTSCVAVLTQYAQAHGVRSLPQLVRQGRISFAAPLDFQDGPDGLRSLEQAYHLKVTSHVPSIPDEYQYSWLRSGRAQAVYCSTTDPQLAGTKYLALRDPKHVFGHGNVVALTNNKTINAEGPVFAETIEKVDSLLTLRAMRGLNAERQAGHDQAHIAAQFLQGNGVLPPSRYAPVPTTTSTTSTSPGS